MPTISLALFKNEWITSATIILFLIINFKWIEYEQHEWKVFLIGVIIGIIAEIGGDLVYKLQYWENGSFFGIPLWLPLLWGYGFIFIRRVGNQIINIH